MSIRTSAKLILIAVTFCLGMTTASSAQITTLANFDGTNGSAPQYMTLVQGPDGNLYGTTERGGTNDDGTVFKMSLSGTITTLHSFSNTSDGEFPAAGLIVGSDGNLYGTTRTGGAHCCGTVFKITPSGTLTTLHSFAGGNEGSGLYGGVIQATDGNFYGTTYTQGAHSSGTVFKMTPDGTVTTLYSFCTQPACTDGNTPQAGLVQANDGNFYGMTHVGGNGQGVVFRITSGGTYTVIHNFDFATEGGNPADALIQASDGYLYGTTYLGGLEDSGTVFKMSLNGAITILYQFCYQLDCSGGSEPIAGLMQASDGNLYGTTTVGGTGHGNVFRITRSGTLTVLYNFCQQRNCADGAGLIAGVMQARDGNIYGVTDGGGTHNDGTVYRISGPALISTTTTLTSAPNPSHLNQAVTMTATVHAQNGSIPVGNVTFEADGVAIGIASLNSSGVAVLNYSGLAIGTHTLVALYQGLNGYAPSTSNTVQQVVQLPASITTVTSTPNPSIVGQQVTITATVGPDGPPPPTGTVSFTSNGTAIAGCTGVVLDSGMAACTTSALPVGTDVIMAAYSGDSNYSPSSGTVVQIVNPVASPLQFVSITPCREVDTRKPDGTFGGPVISGNSSRSFPLAQSGNPCHIPANAVAYSLNVTVVPRGGLGYLTIWPTGEGQPIVSTLNSLDGRIKANAAIVPAGSSSGSVSVYVTNTTDVVLDINGYFIPANGSTLQFYPVAPCRVADTRNPIGPLGGPQLYAGQERDFPVLQSNCHLPNTAAAYSFNFTVVPKTSSGVAYLTVWPQGVDRPVVSTLNDLTNTVVANAGIIPAGSDGGIAAFASNDTELVIDVNGYFAAPGANGLSFYPLTPCRVIDTRHVGNGQPFTGELTVDVVDSPCGPPDTAQGYVFNATVVPQGALGYLTLWPDGQDRPLVSTLNALDQAITSNMAIVPNLDGSTDAYASGYTQLILDLSGYFAP